MSEKKITYICTDCTDSDPSTTCRIITVNDDDYVPDPPDYCPWAGKANWKVEDDDE